MVKAHSHDTVVSITILCANSGAEGVDEVKHVVNVLHILVARLDLRITVCPKLGEITPDETQITASIRTAKLSERSLQLIRAIARDGTLFAGCVRVVGRGGEEGFGAVADGRVAVELAHEIAAGLADARWDERRGSAAGGRGRRSGGRRSSAAAAARLSVGERGAQQSARGESEREFHRACECECEDEKESAQERVVLAGGLVCVCVRAEREPDRRR